MPAHPLPQSHTDQLPGYHSLLLAVDSSDHSNRGVQEGVELARVFGAELSAVHVYAAKLHDVRFRQMEGGLPEQFRQEQELERQRDVHDDLITRGLSIITDSYLDQVEQACAPHGLAFKRRTLEGKNYRELVNEANSGNYDLLLLGALGLGAVQGSRIGSVCARVCRRSQVDTLVIKQPTRNLSDGPIVVAVDGSAKSYGGLLTTLSLAREWNCEVKVISAFDPYYHYVAFNRIAGVLSEEAGKVFRFKEQEQLHEEIIDSGLARIYQGHLSVAQAIAADHGCEVETVLLDGKPHEVILRYLKQVDPSMLVLGTTGIHADAELDIGGNTEYLLNDAPCAVLLSQRTHQPETDRLASVTTSWSQEAEARMERVPSFVRPMARMAILRHAQEQGHTVITEKIVDEATAKLMPGHAEQAMGEIVQAHDQGEIKTGADALVIRWSEAATRQLLTVTDLSLRGNLSRRAEKRARAEGAGEVQESHILPFLDAAGEAAPQATTQPEPSPATNTTPHWQAPALARLMRVPEGFMRDTAKQRIEQYAADQGADSITLPLAEAGLEQARNAMQQMMTGQQTTGDDAAQQSPAEHSSTGGSRCPFAAMGSLPAEQPQETRWDPEAEAMLESVPVGFCRNMTRRAAEAMAAKQEIRQISPAFVENILQTIKAGSAQVEEQLAWSSAARERLARVPDGVRGMLVQEIEGWCLEQGQDQVSEASVDAVKQQWARSGMFHLDPSDPRNG